MSVEAAVHVIDDDEPVLRATRLLLRAHGMPVRAYSSGLDFLKVAAGAEGCVLSDVRMPGIDGIELLRETRNRGCRMPFVVMTGHADVAMAVEAMKAGAMDFIEKPFSDDALLTMLRKGLEIAEMQRGQSSEVTDARSRIALLSTREREVLEAVAEGKASKTIAFDLGLSIRTVEVHRCNLMAKLKVENATSAVALLRRAEEGVG